MRILLINHYAGSPDMGMEFRPYYMAREWVKAGHDVTIIAGDYSHLRMKNPDVQHDFQEQGIDGIRYVWVKTGEYEGNGAARALTMFRFVGKLWRHAKVIAELYKPDVIISSSTYPLDTYAAQRIKKFGGGVLIHEIHDMWPISPMEIGGMSKWHPFIMVMQAAENSFCRNSDKIVSLLPCAQDYLVEHGMPAGNFYHVPNGVVEEEWQKDEPLPPDLEDTIWRLRAHFGAIVCFFGSHTKSYGLTYLVDAAKELTGEHVAFLLVGDGVDKAELMRLAEGCQNIAFHPPIPKASIPSLLKAVDGIYIGATDNSMFQFGICMNKLFDSMMSGRPIIYAVNAPNNYIEEYHCGISCVPENSEALANGVRLFLAMDEEGRKIMGGNGKHAVEERFTYHQLAKRFLEVMEP